MAHRKITLAFTGLYLLVWQAWAMLEVSMEDRVEVFLDSVAEIPCIYKLNKPANSTMIQWFVTSASISYNRVRIYYHDSTVGGIEDQGTFLSGRINMSHFEEYLEGQAILVIKGVRVSDEQDYICQVNVDGESQEGQTKLLVFNAPSSPTIEAGSYTSTYSEEPEQIASCEVTNGYPIPRITWYKDRMPQSPVENVVNIQNTVTENPSGLFTINSKLYLKVRKEDNDADFYCEVTYAVPGAGKMTESNRVKIPVYYPTTTVSVTQESPEGLVKEGDRVELRCQGDGNPQPIKTFIHNNITIDSEEDLVVLQQVTRLDSGLYDCSAFDSVTYDEMTGSFHLVVHFLDPVVITPEKPVSLDEGQDLSLTCSALSSLSVQALWYKDDELLTEGHVLTLNNVSYETAGTYVCEVVTSELADLSKQSAVQINVRGKPRLMLIPVNTKEYVNVSCSAIGHPVPSIQWNLTDEQALLNEWNTITGNSIVSTVSITAASDITVSCTATNELGTAAESLHIDGTKTKGTTTTSTTTTTTKASGTITPQKKTGKEGNGVIIAVIIIFILLLAILGSVLYFLYKKGRISCGRSGKQDLTKEKASSDDIVVELKSSKSEEAVLLQGVNGDKKISGNQ